MNVDQTMTSQWIFQEVKQKEASFISLTLQPHVLKIPLYALTFLHRIYLQDTVSFYHFNIHSNNMGNLTVYKISNILKVKPVSVTLTYGIYAVFLPKNKSPVFWATFPFIWWICILACTKWPYRFCKALYPWCPHHYLLTESRNSVLKYTADQLR